MKTLALLSVILALLAVSLGDKYLGLTAFLLIFLAWGVTEVLLMGELHSLIGSHQRATIESLMTLSS